MTAPRPDGPSASNEVSQAFMLIIDIAKAKGARNINELPSCWEHEFGKWFIAVNGHKEDKKCSHGATVPPIHAFLECNGWPAGLVNPYGGYVIGGTEDDLIAALETELAVIREHQPREGAQP